MILKGEEIDLNTPKYKVGLKTNSLDMLKSKINLFIFLLLIIGISGLMSCEKNSNQDNEVISEITDSSSINTRMPSIIKVTGSIAKKNGTSNKTGANCACSICFGICEVHLYLFDFEIFIAPPPPNSGTNAQNISRVYLSEEHPEAEAEFGIDENVQIPSNALQGSGYQSLILKKGTYEYIEEDGQLTIDGVVHTYVGYVDVSNISS